MSFPEFDNPLWPLLAQVSRPSRYSGSEWRPPRVPRGETLRMCLAFPDVYEIGMSYYGFQVLSAFLEGLPGVSVDRAYCPWVDMERLMREHSLPLLSAGSSIPLAEFDVVGFTLQHELCYTNVLTMLDLAGIPLRAEARGEGSPIVAAGGPGALVPEPVAPFFDLFCVGEGEAVLPGLLTALMEGGKREERLARCASLPGVYVPVLHSEAAPVRRQFVRSFDDSPALGSMIVPSVNIVHDRATVELFRGCSRGCRFCQAGMATRPVRERRPETVVASLLDLVRRTGWEEAGLLSLASCDYSGIDRVIEELAPRLTERGARLSLPSLRMDGFSVNLADRLQKVRRGGLTFAPEAGTQRLRDVINKGIDEESIFTCLDEAFSRGWDRVKLYFMMGLPTETEEDLRGIVRLAQSALSRARGRGRKRASVAVSVAGFVPKAHTPFQWERQNSIGEFREKGRYLRAQVPKNGKALSLNYHEPEQSFLEGVLARGDRKLAGVIEKAWERGARFDGWSETFALERWLDAFEACGVDPASFTRERDRDEALPWDRIQTGVERSFLWRERCAAYDARTTPDCARGCAACGLACGEKDENSGLAPVVLPGAVPPASGGGGAALPLRVFYEKRRGACFVPHVALATVFARAAARAGIGLRRTEGFSPHPRMSFGPELPAGVVALSEPLDVWLEGDFRESLASEWDARMPEGFRVKICVPLPENAPALGKLCEAAHYRVRVERSGGVGNFLRLLEGHYGEDLLNASADGPWISFVVGKPAQNGIGGWVRALVAEGAATGWQDLRIVRLSLGRWDGVRMKSLAEEDVTCLQTKTRAASPTER